MNKKSLDQYDEIVTNNGNIKIFKPWQPEQVQSFYVSVDDSRDCENEALKDFKNGKVSPILFFMHKERLDLGMLAGSSGNFKWQVKRHFIPKVFAKLSRKKLENYAKTFRITTDELINFGKENN